ncbi:MAG TPA: hypothetical protein VKT77_18765 [Chthonomonadaceae bacterium]|nr:hypothetical protein [Chthonomonadaceae bacterium]
MDEQPQCKTVSTAHADSDSHRRLAAERGGAAVVFVRRKATLGIGHVGWGFLVRRGSGDGLTLIGDGNEWEIGAVENHSGWVVVPPLADGYWEARTDQPLDCVATRGYDHYKVIRVRAPNIGAALRAEKVVSERPYAAAVSNCMNDVFNILTAYGAKRLPDPSRLENWIPNNWYGHIEAPEYPVEEEAGLRRTLRPKVTPRR